MPTCPVSNALPTLFSPPPTTCASAYSVRRQVVVSPLVSLMEDQMANLPPQLPGASLSGSHGGLREVAVTVRDLRAGRVKVTFVKQRRVF